MSMMQDMYGLNVTGANPGAIEALNLFGREWIGYGPQVGAILPAAAASPTCPLVQAYAGLLHIALEARSGYDAAKPHLERARALAPGATEREQAGIAAASHCVEGNTVAALTAFERVVALAPSDIVAAKWGQYLAFNLGDAASMLRLAQGILPSHHHTAEAWGMLAFAHEQSHNLAQAEQAARQALALNSDEAWAQHALAHVFETSGRLEEGIKFLQDASPGWQTRSIFMREHNYWHLALFHLDRDEPGIALEIFDDHLWGEWPEFAQEQIGAISLLWRLELRGLGTGARWSEVAAKVQERGYEHIWPFHDLHYVYALARGSDTNASNEFLRSLTRVANSRGGTWARIAIPAAHAFVDYAQDRYEQAANVLAPLLGDFHLIGGSHAQRDVFVQTWLSAATKARQFSAVEHVLAARQVSRPTVAAHRRDLELCRVAMEQCAIPPAAAASAQAPATPAPAHARV